MVIGHFIHDTKRIVSVDDAGAALFRCERLALIDRDMLDLLIDEDARGLAALRLSIMPQHERIPEISYEFRRCDGTTFFATLRTVKCEKDGLFETSVIYIDERKPR